MSSVNFENPVRLRKHELRYLYIAILGILLMGAVRAFLTMK